MTNDKPPERDYENPFVLLEMTVLDCSINAISPQKQSKAEKREDNPQSETGKAEGADKGIEPDR
jgi:hypothetical protein